MKGQPGAGQSTPRRVGARALAGLWTVVGSTFASRILGMLRDTVTARLFGVSPVTDAFWLAFRIPNLARRLFGEGAMTAAFLPAFARELAQAEGGVPRSAWQLASAVFALLAAVLAALVLAGEGVLWLASRTTPASSHTELLLGLAAVMLPYALLICLAAQVTAVLHALGHFTWPALVPLVLNICWIASVWFVAPRFGPDRVAQAYALAACVLGAGVLQLAIQLPALYRHGFRFHAEWSAAAPALRGIFAGMLPVVFGLSIEQINTLLDGLIAWAFSEPHAGARMFLPGGPEYPLRAGAVSALYFSERLYQFPVGVFGVALGTVLFPTLARHAARGDLAHLRDDLSQALRLVLAVGVPASVGLAIVAVPLTRVLLEHGQFTGEDTQRTAALIVTYSAGVWAFCGLPILYRAFYALGDRRLPARVGLWTVASDTLLNLTLIWPLAERGLALSTALSAIGQLAFLSWRVQSHTGRLDWPRLARTAGKSLCASALMAGACLAALRYVPLGQGLPGELAALFVPVVLGIATYAAAAWWLGLGELGLLLRREGTPAAESPAAEWQAEPE